MADREIIIFQNLFANLMQDIIDDPDSDEAQGLVD